jgi:hypothetical protein
VDPDDGSTFWCFNKYAGRNAPTDPAVPYDITEAFWRTAYGSFNVRETVRANDMNNDGFADLALQFSLSGSTSTGRLDLIFMNGLNRILRTPTTPNTSGSLSLAALADVNGDVKTDFIFRNSTSKLRFWTMNGSARIQTLTANPDTSVGAISCSGKFDGDDFIDIVGRNTTSGRHYIYRMGAVTSTSATAGTIAFLGSSEITPPPGVTYPSTARAIRSVSPVAAANGDRYFYVQNTSTGATDVWTGKWNVATNKLVFTSSTPISAVAPASQISGSANVIRGADDMNNDGLVDLIIQNGATIRIKPGISPTAYGAYVNFNPSTTGSSSWTIRNN